MAKFIVFRKSTESIEIEAGSEEEAIEIAQDHEAEEFTEVDYSWWAEED